MIPFTPTQLRRISRALHPPSRRAENGLTELCRQHNASVGSVRRLMSRGLSQEQALAHCKSHGLIFIPRGKKWWEVR